MYSRIRNNIQQNLSGPKLPFQLDNATNAMVTSPNGQGVIIIGGYNHSRMTYSDVFLELKVVGNELKWVQMKSTLKNSRYRHLAIPVPNDFFDCQ